MLRPRFSALVEKKIRNPCIRRFTLEKQVFTALGLFR